MSKDPYRAEVSFKEVQPAYDPAVGFTPRRNFRNWNPELNWQPRFSDHRWFRGVQISAEADINLNLDNQVVDRNLQLTPMELEFHSGDSVEFQLFKQTENLDEDFEISDGVILPAGSSYDWVRYQVVYDGAEHRALSGRVEYSFGDFWNGSRRELNLDLTLRPRPGICRAGVERVQRRQPAGRIVHDAPLSPRRAHAVQSVDLAHATTCSSTRRAARSDGSCASGGFRSRATTSSSSGRRTGWIRRAAEGSARSIAAAPRRSCGRSDSESGRAELKALTAPT